MMFHVNHMKHHALFSSKDKIQKNYSGVCCSFALGFKGQSGNTEDRFIYLGQVRKRKSPF